MEKIDGKKPLNIKKALDFLKNTDNLKSYFI